MIPDAFHAALVAAVTARGQTAQAATPGPWTTPGPDTVAEWSIYSEPRGWMVASACVNSYPDSPSPKLRDGITGDEANRNAAHIAANGPDRILRDVAYALDVLKRHAPDLDCTICGDNRPGLADPCCKGCSGDHNSWARCPELFGEHGLAAACQITDEETT